MFTEARGKTRLELRFHLVADRVRLTDGHLPAANQMKIDVPDRPASARAQIMRLDPAILERIQHPADPPDFALRKLRVQQLRERRLTCLAEMMRIYAATTNAITASTQSHPVKCTTTSAMITARLAMTSARK